MHQQLHMCPVPRVCTLIILAIHVDSNSEMPIIISITLQSQLTALMLAASRGHTAVVRELLTKQDLNINMTDKVHPVQKTLRFPPHNITMTIIITFSLIHH